VLRRSDRWWEPKSLQGKALICLARGNGGGGNLEYAFWMGATSVGNEQPLPLPLLVLVKAKSGWQSPLHRFIPQPGCNCGAALALGDRCCARRWPELLRGHTKLLERKPIMTVREQRQAGVCCVSLPLFILLTC